LFVGGIEARKNLEALVRAFATPGHGHLVGHRGRTRALGPRRRRSTRCGHRGAPGAARARIVRTGYVSDKEKLALLSGATLLAYPSLYEGFGFPVLEAFAAGVPVLTSNVSSLPEVAGEAAVLVDPRDDAAIAAGLAQLLQDEDLRALLSAAGLARAAGFTWEATARKTAEALHRAHGLVAG
jgi:glycosyltransferase involved in cell wall biosynthesis